MIPISDEELRPHKTPYITYILIAANVFFFFTSMPEDIESLGLRAGDFLAGANLLNVFSSMFLHGDILHLLFNMWSLWIFGDNVEDDLGPLGYTFLYLASGIAGAAAFAFTSDPESIAIGASGAISGVMGAYLILHPGNKILTLIPPFFTSLKINAPIFIGIWFLIQFVGFSQASGDGIAYSAHVGGFIAGVILAFILRKRPQPAAY